MKGEIAKILGQIPYNAWDSIVHNEPEWKHLHIFADRYKFGAFANLMLAVGLNDYQLKGKAEIAYWPVIRQKLQNLPAPSTLKELHLYLARFYENERMRTAKLNRLEKYFRSELAREIWESTPQSIATDFLNIWNKLAFIMGQNKSAKTICFAMKCLGIALLIKGEHNFDFTPIPIPVDSRVRKFTKELFGIQSDEEIRQVWTEILTEIRKNDKRITMLHLDSLIWQIAPLTPSEIIKYFEKLGIKEIGEKLVKIKKEG